MRTYIAVTSSSQQYVSGLMTCFEMERSDGDALYPRYDTQGYVAREEHARMFLGEPFDAMLLLDADMKHQKDALERLRSHGLDIVCGHYYKRKTSPMESAILELDEGLPPPPLFSPPREGLARDRQKGPPPTQPKDGALHGGCLALVVVTADD